MFNFNFNIIYIVNNINERIIFTKNVIQNTFVVFIEKPEDVISAKKRIESYTNEYESEVFIIGGKTIYDSFMNGVSGIKLKSAVVTCLNYGGGLLPSIDYPKNTRFDTFFDYNFLNKIMRKVKYSYLGSDVKFSNFKKLNELFHSRLTDVIIQFKPKGLISRTFSLMN